MANRNKQHPPIDQYPDSDGYGVEEDEEAPPQNNEEGGDLINYKGIYFNDDQGQKYTDPVTGAHFEYKDMCRRLHKAMLQRDALDKQIDKAVVVSQSQNFNQQQSNSMQHQALDNKLSALQREKEEFIRSLGLQKQAQQQKVQQKPLPPPLPQPLPQLEEQPPMQARQGQIGFTALQQQIQLIQQHQQQQQQAQNQSQTKWRSKSNEKKQMVGSNGLSSSQKITLPQQSIQGKGVQQPGVEINQFSNYNMGIPGSSTSNAAKRNNLHQNDSQILRNKTPDNFNNKAKAIESQQFYMPQSSQNNKAKVMQQQQQQQLNDTQSSAILNNNQLQTRSSQRSTRDKQGGGFNPGLTMTGLSKKFNLPQQSTAANALGSQGNSRNKNGGNLYSKTIANNNNGSKTATINKSATYAPKQQQASDLESLMAKFNNSLAIQNILGATNPNSQFKASTSKSRNTGTTQNNPQFKTTAAAVGLSLGSTKGIGKTLILGQQPTSSTANSGMGNLFFADNGLTAAQKQSIINSATSHGKRTSGSTNQAHMQQSNIQQNVQNKFNQTIVGGVPPTNLYTMMYQQQKNQPQLHIAQSATIGSTTQKKNLVSSYLKGIDNKRSGQASGGHTKMIGTSRNQQLVAPAGTKNKIGGGTNVHMGMAASSSLGASIEDIQMSGVGGGQSINLNRTLGGTATGGGRYF
ncbi:hypothetical protein FGO68_gene6086 [Halteria grandinella]|uniref:Uncharacterized protein n=1 Tax=Halteria grandinella TaxID=5974 RepID=A0A8J8NV24_HALGN|nr:hypothetical protein FGO68_gene6086 [Halteria grandinella]